MAALDGRGERGGGQPVSQGKFRYFLLHPFLFSLHTFSVSISPCFQEVAVGRQGSRRRRRRRGMAEADGGDGRWRRRWRPAGKSG